MNVQPVPKQGPKPKKKRTAKPSTDKAVATTLASKIIRDIGECEAAGMFGLGCDGPLQCAHMIRRNRAATRTDLENLRCICQRHHTYLDSHLADLIGFVGIVEYKRLQEKADAGSRATGMSLAAFWKSERTRLRLIADSRGIK